MANHPRIQLAPGRLYLLFFLALWFIYGVLINSGNLNAFGLQHVGVEAYVARHNFYLEGATDPRLKVEPVVDAFLFNGHVYPAKQPGQFMLGALIYFPLHTFGLTYTSNYLVTTALVTFFSAGFVAALSAAFLFSVARRFATASGLFWPLVVALSYALGSTIAAYSGIAWHDTLATGYLVMAVYFIVRLAREQQPNRDKFFAAGAGLLLGLTITTSMLPFLLTLVAAAYFLSLRRWALIVPFILGGVLGVAPLLIYNMVCFGNPLLVPNLAGNYSDTFFRPTLSNLLSKVQFYSRMITLYVPVFWAGLVGLLFFPARLRREQIFIGASLAALFLYVLNIEATGTCQYGPRYLLPAMPFASLGLIGFSFVSRKPIKILASASVLVVLLASAGINVIGAMHGSMLCDYPHSAWQFYLSEMMNGQMRSFPLAKWLFLPMVAAIGLFVFTIIFTSKQAGSNGETI